MKECVKNAQHLKACLKVQSTIIFNIQYGICGNADNKNSLHACEKLSIFNFSEAVQKRDRRLLIVKQQKQTRAPHHKREERMLHTK